jgi:hypothetical protein
MKKFRNAFAPSMTNQFSPSVDAFDDFSSRDLMVGPIKALLQWVVICHQ